MTEKVKIEECSPNKQTKNQVYSQNTTKINNDRNSKTKCITNHKSINHNY